MAYKSNKHIKSIMYIRYGKMCMICDWKPSNKKKHKFNKHSNYLTYHHLIEKQDGGPTTVENGAILCRFCHEWLNTLPKEIQEEQNNMLRKRKSVIDQKRG